MRRLLRGDLLPDIVTSPPGPRSLSLADDLRRHEAPGINTVPDHGAKIAWSEACGANVLDVDGNRYLDFTSGFGVAAVGHRHPRVVAALRAQSERLLHGLGDVQPHPLRARLAERLAACVPVDDPQVYFGVSGADAVEIALGTALLATGRHGVLAFKPSYHGLTLGALALTSRPAFRSPFAHWLPSSVRHLPYGCDPALVTALLEREKDFAAVVFEPVVGREGVIFPPPGWLAAITERARQQGVLVVTDEIFAGFGRTGYWFGIDNERVRPDLLVCGKALGGGLPIAAVVGRSSLLEAWRRPGEALHTATFVAHPPACATALATLDVLEEQDLPARAGRLGTLVKRRTCTWPDRFTSLVTVRGRGLLWALELSSATIASQLAAALLSHGVLALVGGATGTVLQLMPPLVVTEKQLATGLDILESALEEILL